MIINGAHQLPLAEKEGFSQGFQECEGFVPPVTGRRRAGFRSQAISAPGGAWNLWYTIPMLYVRRHMRGFQLSIMKPTFSYELSNQGTSQLAPTPLCLLRAWLSFRSSTTVNLSRAGLGRLGLRQGQGKGEGGGWRAKKMATPAWRQIKGRGTIVPSERRCACASVRDKMSFLTRGKTN